MKCYLNIPLLKRTKENIEKSISQMTMIAKAKWGDDIEIVYSESTDSIIDYLKQCINAVSECDYVITTVDTMFCADHMVIQTVGQTTQFMNVSAIMIHCMDWFPDSTQDMEDVRIN